MLIAFLEGKDDFLYRVLFLAHILVSIIGFGTVYLNGVYAAQAKKRPGPGGLAILEANEAVSQLAEKVIYLVPIFGLLLVWKSDGVWALSQTWVWLSLVLYAVGIAVAHGVMAPGASRINELVRTAPGPPPPEVEDIGKRLAMGGAFLDILVIVLLVLMIWKPGF